MCKVSEKTFIIFEQENSSDLFQTTEVLSNEGLKFVRKPLFRRSINNVSESFYYGHSIFSYKKGCKSKNIID